MQAKLSMARVEKHGDIYEVHQIGIDEHGQKWEYVTGGPFETVADATEAARVINSMHGGLR